MKNPVFLRLFVLILVLLLTSFSCKTSPEDPSPSDKKAWCGCQDYPETN